MNDIGWTDAEIRESREKNNELNNAYKRGYDQARKEFERSQGGVSYLHQDSITKSVTQIPFPPVNTNAVCILKCCDTCKHKDKLMTQEPCFSCETKNGWYEKWEAKDDTV